MSDITLQAAPLPDDQRIDFDADSRTITVDDSDLTDDEVADVARIAAVAVSALVPGMTLTPGQARVVVRVILQIVDIAQRMDDE